MPYFSFSIKENLNSAEFENIKQNITYYSKNTKLWKLLHSRKMKSTINFVKFENRIKVSILKKKILFCVPPSIGLGDAIEYGLAINSIKKNLFFKKIGVAFVGKYSFLYKKYFLVDYIYADIISDKEIKKYDNVFHFTLEIEELKKQKYVRSNIAELISKYFNLPFKNTINFNKNKTTKIKTISLFPISNSPIRTMPISLINELILFLKNRFNIEVYFNNNSKISNYIENNIIKEGYKKIDPIDCPVLIKKIENIEYGIFVDSGPLHVAKLLGKKGIFIETSVSNNILLKNFNMIKPCVNSYKSSFCKAPCGLIDTFNYKNRVGCYDTLEITKNEILNLTNFNILNRGRAKKNILFYLLNPVGCIKTLNIKRIIKQIEEDLS